MELWQQGCDRNIRIRSVVMIKPYDESFATDSSGCTIIPSSLIFRNITLSRLVPESKDRLSIIKKSNGLELVYYLKKAQSVPLPYTKHVPLSRALLRRRSVVTPLWQIHRSIVKSPAETRPSLDRPNGRILLCEPFVSCSFDFQLI